MAIGRTFLTFAFCLLLSAFFPPGAGIAARQKPTPLDVDRLRAWLAALDRHAPGKADAPVIEIGSWPVDEAFATISDFVALVRGRRDAQARLVKTGRPADVAYLGIHYTTAQLDQLLGLTATEAATGDANRAIKRAVLLYTDIADFEPLVPRASSTPTATNAGRMPLVIKDGRQVAGDAGSDNHGVHWEFARLLANEVGPDASKDPAVRLWYHAVAAYMESQREWAAAAFHTERARATRPSDPVLLFRSGVVHEFFAGPQAQGALQTVTIPKGMRLGFESELAELRQAEEFFRQAVAGDPGWAEARLHWGHVLSALGHDDAAGGELSRARDELTDPVLVYYADLFLGRSQGALGDRDDARASFERAAAAFPRAQSPLLALSELARHAGDVPEALRSLERLLTLPSDRREDPWWTYDVSASRNADALMAGARAALAGGGGR